MRPDGLEALGSTGGHDNLGVVAASGGGRSSCSTRALHVVALLSY